MAKKYAAAAIRGYTENSASRVPRVTAIESSDASVAIHIKVGDELKVVRKKNLSDREKLGRVFSRDVVDVILSETPVSGKERPEVLGVIARQFKKSRTKSRRSRVETRQHS